MEVYNKKQLFENKKVYDILNYLYENGPVSRMDIAKMLSLTKSAVTVITNKLIEKGILKEIGERIPESGMSTGRRKVLIYINENYCPVLGMTIYNNTIYLGLSNLIGQTLSKSKAEILPEDSYRDILEKIVALVNEMLKDNCLSFDNLLAFGICLDEKSGEFVGTNESKDALTRLSRDISHALTVKIAASDLFYGAMMAQYLFCKDGEYKDSFLLLDGLNEIKAGVMLDKRVYEGKSKKAADFFDKDDYTVIKKGTVKRLATQIDLRAKLFDVEDVFYFGGMFENQKIMSKVENEIALLNDGKLNLDSCICSLNSLYLAGCAIAIGYYFFGKNN